MTLTKAEREAGYKQLPQPSPFITSILRRVARGYLLVTQDADNKTIYCYDDGTPVYDFKGRPITTRAISHMAREGWLLPIKGETLFPDGTPQRYRARTLDDPILPRWTSPPR